MNTQDRCVDCDGQPGPLCPACLEARIRQLQAAEARILRRAQNGTMTV